MALRYIMYIGFFASSVDFLVEIRKPMFVHLYYYYVVLSKLSSNYKKPKKSTFSALSRLFVANKS